MRTRRQPHGYATATWGGGASRDSCLGPATKLRHNVACYRHHAQTNRCISVREHYATTVKQWCLCLPPCTLNNPKNTRTGASSTARLAALASAGNIAYFDDEAKRRVAHDGGTRHYAEADHDAPTRRRTGEAKLVRTPEEHRRKSDRSATTHESAASTPRGRASANLPRKPDDRCEEASVVLNKNALWRMLVLCKLRGQSLRAGLDHPCSPGSEWTRTLLKSHGSMLLC